MRLGIDMDGVIADFTTGWMAFYNRQYGTNLTVADSKMWNDVLELTHFKDVDEFWDWASDLGGHSIFWHLEPYPGAVEALRSLADAGHQIIILTTKPSFAVDDTFEWIERHRVPAAEIHILEDKWTVACAVYLDDNPGLLPRLVVERPASTVCRYVRPWNVPVPGAVDIADFGDFRHVVNRLAAK
jgi:uncharacterized HAD superfamily protein